jgi:dTDP-4-amino-4,6-dideoxygalactose transaminase
MQRDLEDFEKALASYLQVRHVIGTADGTVALLGGLIASGVKPGDEVIVPSHTFVASAAAIHHAGAKPVLVECGRDHLIDPQSAARAVTRRTRGIMPVQLNGRTAKMEPLLALVADHNLVMIEDSCQAIGSKYKNRCAGTFGSAGAASFYPSKTLGAFGDGGAVLTNSDEVAQTVREWRDHGRGPDGKVRLWGFNARLDNLQAAILLQKLKSYDAAIARRRALARLYQARLGHLEELLLPPGPDDDPDHFDIYQNYEIEAERRDDLRKWLDECGVKTILQWGGHMIHHFKDLGFDVDLPATDRVAERYLLLPLHTALSDDDVHYVCDKIELFYRRALRTTGRVLATSEQSA